MKKISSGREKTLKKALAKESNLENVKRKREPGTCGDVKAESTGRRADWRTAALAIVCFFGCKR